MWTTAVINSWVVNKKQMLKCNALKCKAKKKLDEMFFLPVPCTSNYTKTARSGDVEMYTCHGHINSLVFTVEQTDKFLWFALGCVRLPFWGERLSREGKQTDRARPVDLLNHPGGGGLLQGRSVGEAERRGRYRCEPCDKMESFRNRIMASCLKAPQIVCQVTAALNRDVFIWESGGGRMRKQEQQRVLVLFTGIMI